MNIINPVKNPYAVSRQIYKNAAQGASGGLQLIFLRKHIRSRVLVTGAFHTQAQGNADCALFASPSNSNIALGSLSIYPSITTAEGTIMSGDGASRAVIPGIGKFKTTKQNGLYMVDNLVCFDNYLLPIGFNMYWSAVAATGNYAYDLTFIEELL